MNSSVTKTLLALLLALKKLEIPLSEDEQALLQDVGQQLALDPDYWEFIEPELITIIQANSTLHQLFEAGKVKLDALDGRIPRELLPSLAYLEKERFGETKEITTFDGQIKGEPNNQLNPVISLTSSILRLSNQDHTVKQLPFIQEISDYVENYRYFNTYFANPDDACEGLRHLITVPPSEPLIHGQTYLLLVDISPERKGIESEPTPFPDQALAQVWNDSESLPLDLVVASKDFNIDTTVKKLTLPRIGASDSVQFTVKPNLFEGRGYIQVDLLYRGYLLQSKQLAVIIIPVAGAEIPESLRPPQTATITFTTTDLLTHDKLALLPERFLTVDVQIDTRDGSTDLRFLDRTQGNQELVSYSTNLQSGLGSAIARMRQKLHLMATAYQFKTQGDITLLNTWLPQLADAGRYLYRSLLPENKGSLTLGEDKGEKLRAALKPDSVIQVNPINPMVGLGKSTIPWALLYERKVMTSKGVHVCEEFLNHDIDCTGCSFKENYKVVCPHAFWGYRYAIEQLPAWTSEEHSQTPTLVWQIANNQPLYINFNVWRDFRFWKNHLPKIEQLGTVKILIAEEINDLEMIWANHSSDLDIVYFYCHGGIDEIEQLPYLQLSDDKIYSNFIEACEVNWQHRPLVLLNGCATGDYSPESYISLIDDFRAAGASGVIGTECPVPELFAELYAFTLLKRVFRGEPLGKAMLAVRREMLQHNLNPLGLLYSLYAPYEIALARALAQPNLGIAHH
ncbi:CHAT domain-containing protein [Calothrix sp. FACHB-1219]|uniref:CHAT domain-containing protein n=1 Tax=unclassified Calothrix TaxID=2619626 RepID=UPI001687AEF1|nr:MULTISPECIES: CHAT domain-containing protein [unclassified Calothrix]MBD2208103.1 CHAT domain-containing protein [Calothrix sp. FACHB-168]MBD2222650.1 CHAT domain-containing protein [Calothrix sp. FACHB-1219]